MEHRVMVGDLPVSNSERLVVIAGPCQLESAEMCVDVAMKMKRWCDSLGIGYIFKGSFDKANRTSGHSQRGPGMYGGLAILRAVKAAVGCKMTTDVHEVDQCGPVADVVDLIQIPAMLQRQTDLIAAAGATGLPVNIKKWQGSAPESMRHAALKVGVGQPNGVLLTERGTTFGYHDLVADMRSLVIMREEAGGWPVIMDASHAAQAPSVGEKSGGDRAMVPVLARAAVAVGVAGVFIECHPDPDRAYSDGATSMRLEHMPSLLAVLMQIDDVVKRRYA
jgi:2-dehydro-3-deoxyphosphooctonate aldolase (KDO 8-P synthase)